jgi:cytoskeleton protein RodZ
VAGRHRKQHAVLPHVHRGRHRRPPSRPRAILPTIAIVAALAVGGVMFSHAVAQGQAPGEAAAAPQTPAVVPPVVRAAPSPPATSPRPKPAHRARAKAHRPAPPAFVVADVRSSCYVQVSRHGQLLTRRILRHGQRLTVRRPGLTVVLGNAGAVRISLNGHRSHRAGRLGQVRTFRVR